MRKAVLMVLSIGLLALMAGFAVQPPPVQAQSTGLIRFINNTADPLVFSVDGDEETCRATPQRECNVRYEVGEHSLFAEYDDGRSRARKVIDLTSAGYIWTIDKQK